MLNSNLFSSCVPTWPSGYTALFKVLPVEIAANLSAGDPDEVDYPGGQEHNENLEYELKCLTDESVKSRHRLARQHPTHDDANRTDDDPESNAEGEE